MNPKYLFVALLAWVAVNAGQAHLAEASDIGLATTTATFSQTGFEVENIVDFDVTSGWAISTGTATTAQSAFIESATHFGVLAANDLTFNIAHNSTNAQHGVGKFRLSYTTDQGTLGDGSTWKVLKPKTATSSGGATLTINPDRSILASGTNPTTDTYTIKAKLPEGVLNATGFRLETLEDASLPDNGPGRFSPNGNFVLTDFSADVSSRIGLQQATSNFSQTNFPISETINGISGYPVGGASEGWGFGLAPATVNGSYETVTDVGFTDGTKLQFGIDHRSFASHNLENVKFYVTGDARTTFANGVSNGGDPLGTATWVEIVPLSATSEGGALVSIAADNRISFGGTNPSFDTYTIQAISPISNVTGMRMEIIGTKGRNGSNGNAVVSEVTLDAAETKLVALTSPSVTHQQASPFVIANSINGDYHTSDEGWGVFDGQSANQSAVFQTTAPLNDAKTLTFTMLQELGGSHTIQKFRLSATTDASPTTVSGAAWTVLDPHLIFLDNSGGFTVDADHIVTISGAASVDRYTVLTPNSLQGITGFLLEVFTGDNGFLGFSANGNFVLNEFVVEASSTPIVPEPSTYALALLGTLSLVGLMWRRRSRVSQ